MHRFVLLALLTAMTAPAFAADTIPSRLQKEADLAFAQGKPYFIWTTNAQPIKGTVNLGFGSIVNVNFQVLAESGTNSPDFRVHGELDAADAKKTGITTYTSVFPGGSSPGFSYEGPGSPCNTGIFANGGRLTGSGTCRIRLIPSRATKAETNFISNTLDIKVTFQ